MLPPSVNHYKSPSRTRWGAYRVYLTPEAVAFKKALAIAAGKQRIRAKRYFVTIEIVQGPSNRGDLDNYMKCVLDGLQDAGVIDTDARVTRILAMKSRDPRGGARTVITVVEDK